MKSLSRRRFLKTSAGVAAGAGALSTVAVLANNGSSYAIQGIDVSHWQGTINWNSVRNNGNKRFAFCKATEGTGFVDPRFASNWAAMREVGLYRGAYHFGRPGSDPVAQANHFCNVVNWVRGNIRPVLDIEVTDGQTPTAVRNWIVAFVNRIVQRLGQTPIIYTGYYFWRDSAGNGSSLGCPLWLAYWGDQNPQNFVPAAWNTFTIWQYSSTGSVPGITGNVDLNALNGDMTTLNQLRLL